MTRPAHQALAQPSPISPWRVILPVSLATALSLPGDSSMYTVLATHTAEAGVVLAAAGILLSINRWVRLPLNAPAGLLIEKRRRRHFFVPAMFLGAISTAIYAVSTGFWPLFVGRLLWGIAWVGIWVSGNTIVLDISHKRTRGRWVGIYQMAFFMGAAGGAMLGGLLTDWLGYHRAMGINALIGLAGALIALFLLPETRPGMVPAAGKSEPAPGSDNPNGLAAPDPGNRPQADRSSRRNELFSASALLAVNRIATAGFLTATLGLFLRSQLGEVVSFAGRSIGVTSLTGLGLGLTTLIAIAAAPISGRFSDRVGRWPAIAAGLIPGIIGFSLLAIGQPVGILIGLTAIPLSSGSNTSLSTALVGDLSAGQAHGRWLGLLYTVGDLASAVGPLLVFMLRPLIGLNGVYLLSAALFSAMWLLARLWVRRKQS